MPERSLCRNQRRRSAATIFSLALGVAVTACVAWAAGPEPPHAQPAVSGNRAPHQLVFSPDGTTVYVTESAEGTVAVVDAESRRVLRRIPTGGERPVGLALSPDGKELAVANSYSGSVTFLPLAGDQAGKIRATARVPGMPWGVAYAADGKRLFATVSQLDTMAVIDPATANVTKQIPVGHRPRALQLTPDGKRLVVANLSGGSLSLINTETLAEERKAAVRGVNVRGVAVTADGEEAYATLMPPFNSKPTDDPREVWHNVVQAVSLFSPEARAEDQWMDFVAVPGAGDVFGSPDGEGIVLDEAAKHAWVAVSGRDVVTRLTIHDRRRISIWPFSQIDTLVGANPRGLALRPGGREVWVTNYLGNSVSVVDALSPKTLATIDLGAASHVDPTVAGQYLFNNAGLTRVQRFSCNSCHPDGSSDGLTWRFVHVKDGVDRRNSRDLRGGVGDTAPFRWSGIEVHLSEFINDEVTGLLGGRKPTPDESRALAEAISAFRLPPNPYRAEEGGLTPEAKRGEALFAGKAGCAGCHAGPRRGGTGMKAWVGTSREGQPLDVPHLTGAYDSAPYLHDGRAATLDEVFTKYNREQKHGAADALTPDELSDLLRFVREQ